MPDRECPRCGRVQPSTIHGDKCLFCGADLPPLPAEAPVAAPSAPAPAAEDFAAPSAVEPGKRPCPRCGELLYESEQRCWRCGQSLEAPPAAAQSVGPPPPQPLAPPPSADLPTTAPLPPPPPQHAPSAGAARTVDPQAQTLAVWALVLGILGLIPCLGLSAPVAIYLGVRANRLGPNTFGKAGIVLGIIGTVLLAILVALTIIGFYVQQATALP